MKNKRINEIGCGLAGGILGVLMTASTADYFRREVPVAKAEGIREGACEQYLIENYKNLRVLFSENAREGEDALEVFIRRISGDVIACSFEENSFPNFEKGNGVHNIGMPE